jgi:hypothetical protein
MVVVTRVIEVNEPPKSRPRVSVAAASPAAHPPLQLDPLPPADKKAAKPEPPPLPARAHAPPPLPPGATGGSPKSQRPMAPDMFGPESKSSIAETFERLLMDVDAGFESLERDTDRGLDALAEPVLLATELEEVRQLFAQLAANHMRQVRDFMIDVKWGEAAVEWIAICQPAVTSLRRAAEKLDLPDLVVALDAFAEGLALAQTTGARVLEGEERDLLLARYEALGAMLPAAFALDMDRSQREAVILQSLLLQVPDVKKVTIDKLYSAGLTSLEAMLLASADDIVATTGIPQATAASIVTHFREYHEQNRQSSPDATRARERETIACLVSRLKSEHTEYEQVAEDWSREARDRKKELRAARARTLLDLNVLLARLGEVETLRELERLPFDKKIPFLATFLEEARRKYVAPPPA